MTKTFVFCHDCKNLLTFMSSDDECLVALNPDDKQLFNSELSYIKHKICADDYPGSICQYQLQLNEIVGYMCIYMNFEQICRDLNWNASQIDHIAFRHYRRYFADGTQLDRNTVSVTDTAHINKMFMNSLCTDRKTLHCALMKLHQHVDQNWLPLHLELCYQLLKIFDEPYSSIESNEVPQKYLSVIDVKTFKDIFNMYYHVYLDPMLRFLRTGIDIKQATLDIVRQSKAAPQTLMNVKFLDRYFGFISEQIFGQILMTQFKHVNFEHHDVLTYIKFDKNSEYNFIESTLKHLDDDRLHNVLYIGHCSYGERLMPFENASNIRAVEALLEPLHNNSFNEDNVIQYKFANSQKVTTYTMSLQQYARCSSRCSEIDIVYMFNCTFWQLQMMIPMLCKYVKPQQFFIHCTEKDHDIYQAINMYFDESKVTKTDFMYICRT